MRQDRLSRLEQAMRGHRLDAMALIPGPSLFYMTGLSFHMMERPVIGLFPSGGKPCLVLPELELAKAQGLDLEVEPYGEEEAARSRALSRAVEALSLSGRRIGVEPLRMRVLELRLLEQAAPRAEFISGEAAISSLRVAKDAAEVDAMRQAVAVAEAALEATLPLIRLGMTERELASELAAQLLRAGSDPELPFAPIVATGPNSAIPHAFPSDRRLQAGDLLILDWGASVRGYVSDLTRTLAVGSVEAELRRVHEVVQQANAAGRWSVRPGVACAEVDRAARSIIAAAGYADRFIHRTGHGIGLEAHEPPYIRDDNPQPLVSGMTFTVEPGIYLPGRGGVRIEDNMLVTGDRGDCLTSLDRDLKEVG